MARSKKGNRPRKSKTGNTVSGEWPTQRETSQQSTESPIPAPKAVTLTSKYQDDLPRHETISDERNISGFTLADVARETSLHNHSIWSERSKLRKKPVRFVRSGSSKPLKSSFFHKTGINTVSTMTTDCTHRHEFHIEESDQPPSSPTLGYATSNSVNTKYLNTTLQMQAIEPVTRQSTCANDVFVIDTIGKKTIDKSQQILLGKIPERHSSPDSSSSNEVILFRGRKSHSKAGPITGTSHSPSLPTMTSLQSRQTCDDVCSLASASQPHALKGEISRHHKRENNCSRTTEKEDPLLDYIDNIRESGELDDIYERSQHVRYDLGGSDEEVFLGSDQSGDETRGVSHISDDDSRQHPSNKGSIFDIGQTDQSKVEKIDGLVDSSDEHHDLAANSMLGPSLALNVDSFRYPSSWNTQRRRDNLNQEQADFDNMDWNRPSLQTVHTGKGIKAQHISFDNCDSDLELQLQVAHNKDRLRKKMRKQQREELRSKGMLRKTATWDDLSVKYPLGMTTTEVADELRSFLENRKEILTFPPMDLHARRMVHELANKFNIKSKSIGKGEQRRPGICRTIRTRSYSKADFDQAVDRSHHPFLSRLCTKGKGKPSFKMQNRFGSSRTAVNYQEGEIVGAAAPELGTNNRGRAILEKMGWSCGTALGAEDNKGILQPVSLAMKRSRAGLG